MEDEKLTVKEIATEYKITTRTVSNWMERGLPYIKIGRMVRILRSELIKFIEEGNA